MPRKKDTPENSSPDTFEGMVTALRPLAAHYGITSDKQVKLRIADSANVEDVTYQDTREEQLNAIAIRAGDRVTISRDRKTLFVRFDELSYEEAAIVLARVFGETS